jgi:hypothetical protein
MKENVFFADCPAVATRVKTPMGEGMVIGYIARGKTEIRSEVIVSLNRFPFDSSDRGGSLVMVDSFRLDQVEVIAR